MRYLYWIVLIISLIIYHSVRILIAVGKFILNLAFTRPHPRRTLPKPKYKQLPPPIKKGE